MWKLLIKINAKLIIAIPCMMVVGFCFGVSVDQTFIARLKILILPLTFLMVYPMMVSLNIKHLQDGIKNVRLQLATQFINFAIIPSIAYGLGLFFFHGKPYMALGLLLAALLPTSGMTISWTGFAKGNMGAAINMTVIGLTLGSIATPFYIQALMGTKVEVNFMLIVKQIVIIVLLPMVFGFFTRLLLIKKYGPKQFKETLAPRFPAASTLGVLGIVFVAIALKAQTIAHNPTILVSIIIPLLLVYGLNFSLSTLAGRLLFQRDDAIALVYGTVMRNLSIALAIAINAFGSAGAETALVIAVSYIIQVQAAAWYVNFTDIIFGPTPSLHKEQFT